MLNALKKWIEPPQFPDDKDATAQANLLNSLILTFGALLLIVVIVLLPFFAVQKLWTAVILLPIIFTLFLGRYLLFRRKQKLAIWAVITVSFASFFFLVLHSGGKYNPGLFFLAMVILVSGFVLDIRSANIVLAAAMGLGLIVVIMEEYGLTVTHIFDFSGLTGWLTFMVGVVFMTSVRNIILQNLTAALADVRSQNILLHQAEQSLRESEEKYRGLVEGSPDAICIYVDGKIVFVNAASVRLMRASCPEQLLGKSIIEFVHPDSRALVIQRMQAASKTGDALPTAEEKFVRLDGTELDVEVKAIPIHFNNNRAVQIIVHDITARKQSEAALIESQAMTQAIFDSTNDLIWSVNAQEFRLMAFNQSLIAYFQSERGLTLYQGMRIDELLQTNDAIQDWYGFYRRTLDEGPFSVEYQVTGTPNLLLLRFSRLKRDGKVFGISVFGKDITQRKQLEQALRQSEEKYRQMVELANEGVVAVDAAENLTLVNRQMAAMLGYPIEEMLGHKFSEYLDEAELINHRMQMEQRSRGKSSVYERCFRHRDGVKVWTIVSATPIFDDKGGFLGSFGVVTDITDRKKAEEDIARMALALDVAPSAITVHDFDGHFLYANQRCFDLHGYTREEFLNLHLSDLDTPDSAAFIESRMVELQTRGEVSFEVEHRRKDGSVFPLEVSVRITLWGENWAILSVATDITDRKQAESVIRESEERFRAVVQSANDAIITMNTDGKVVSWNQAAQMIFGYSAQEAIGMAAYKIVPEKYRLMHQNVFRKPVDPTGQALVGRTVDGVGLTRDGIEFPIEMSLAEWRMQTDVFLTVVIRDVSERNRRQVELQAITTLSAALRAAGNRKEMIPIILRELDRLLQCDSISVEMIDPLSHESVVDAAVGHWANMVGVRQPDLTGLNKIISESRKPYHNNRIQEDAPIAAVPAECWNGITAGAGVPLIAQDQLIGYLWIGRKNDISETEVRLLAAVADIAANAMHRATLHERTQKDAFDLSLAYTSTLEGWAHALELRDQETEGHTRRVVQMTVALAQEMGIQASELENIRRGALLHDIGKMGIPDSVLLKPGTLNEREWEIMRRHPAYAYELLHPISYLHPVLDIPACHHEKWDGSGYPKGLAGEQIPLGARVFAIVDVWDALRSDRPYRTAWSFEEARKYILDQSGKHFDPQVVTEFVRLVDKDRAAEV